jgi:hypothetical protein
MHMKIVATLIFVSFVLPMSQPPADRPFTVEEAGPLLKVLSKLHSISVVEESPFAKLGWPHICFAWTSELLPLNQVLPEYPGAGAWYLFSDLPRLCLAVQPNARRPQPDRTSQEEFRAKIIAEMPQLSSFIEDKLNLKLRPELGVELSSHKFDLPFMEDHSGPGDFVLLVADPSLYAETGAPTSSLDRTLHFGITREEALGLSDALGANSRWLSLWADPYTPVMVPPSKVSGLRLECTRLQKHTSQKLLPAIERLLSICHSAEKYGLGIYVPAI